MFISDIHGSSYWLERAIEKVWGEQAKQIVMLGDFLYHGPRNPLPDGYDPQQVAGILNPRIHFAAKRGLSAFLRCVREWRVLRKGL